MAILLCSHNVFICAHKIVSINLQIAERDRYNPNNHIELKICYYPNDSDREIDSLNIPIYDYKNAVQVFQHLIEQIREQQPDKLFIDSKLFGDDNSFKNNSDFIKREIDEYAMLDGKLNRFEKAIMFIKQLFKKRR